VSPQSWSRDFEQDALPHLNSAYNLARWLTHNDQDAEDIVQEAYMRAFRSYHGYRGGDARPWLLTIVRNVYYTSLQQSSFVRLVALDEDAVGVNPHLANPEDMVIQNSNGALLRRAVETLPPHSREVLILRELDGMSYKQISAVLGVPTGTVMSRLSRARASLCQLLTNLMGAGPETTAKK
jgi:RNA polymerase sigma-70 factor (ECF subfamily)